VSHTTVSDTPSWAEIQLHVAEKIDQNTSSIRSELKEANQSHSERMDRIDQKIESYSLSMDNKLDKINLKCDTTSIKVDERFDRIEMLFNKMWGGEDKNQKTSTPEMDYQIKRDELQLKSCDM
jgi:hypothetical protein